MATETVKEFFRRLKQGHTMKAFIYRGVSGSGKSTMALKLRQSYSAGIYSADDFFRQNSDLKYDFDPTLINEAHKWCLTMWIKACQRRENLLVCDNTNTKIAEFAPYVAVAQAYGYVTEVVTIICDPEIAALRNKHGVTLAMAQAQHEQLMEDTAQIPGWWPHTILNLDYKQHVLAT